MPDPKPSTEFELVIVTPDQTIWEGQARQVFFPGVFGEVAVLPDHTPFYGEVNPGDIKVVTSAGSQENFPTESGIVRVKNNRVSIILGFK